jgi:hypothetical protein
MTDFLPQDIETLRHLVQKLVSDSEATKKGLQAANVAIEGLRAEVADLKTAQIARGHDPD